MIGREILHFIYNGSVTVIVLFQDGNKMSWGFWSKQQDLPAILSYYDKERAVEAEVF